MLLESGIRAAEKMGLDIFITATKAGRGVYLKSGCTLLGEIIQDNSEWGGDGEWVQAFFEKSVKK